MSEDNSDNGEFPGERYFTDNKENKENKENDENFKKEMNDDYSEKDNQYENYNNNYINYDYKEEIEEYEEENQNEQNDQYDNYYNSYNYNENSNYNEYPYYTDDYDSKDSKNHFNNKQKSYFKKNRNNYENKKNQKKDYFTGGYKHFIQIKNKPVITKDNCLASFQIKFKTWLIIVIKMIKEEGNPLIFDEDEKINNEIIDAFLEEFDKYMNNKDKTKLYIKNISIKPVVGRDINILFDIIIKDQIDLFFIKKKIIINVTGEIYYDKNPKFFFKVKKYKIYLTKKINNELVENDRIIVDKICKYENIKNDNCIEMCSKYNYNNKDDKFKKLTNKYYNNKKPELKKGPQEELRECLFDISSFFTK